MKKYSRFTSKEIHQMQLQPRLDKTCERAPSVCPRPLYVGENAAKGNEEEGEGPSSQHPASAYHWVCLHSAHH